MYMMIANRISYKDTFYPFRRYCSIFFIFFLILLNYILEKLSRNSGKLMILDLAE